MKPITTLFIATLLSGLSAVALAQVATYPSKPVRLVVPFAAGGPIDLLARAVGAKLSVSTGQQFIVDNKPGAGSIIAWDHVAKSAPDGYTLLVAGIGTRTAPGNRFKVSAIRSAISVRLAVQFSILAS